MTIPLSTSGGLFTRLGHLEGWLRDVQSFRGGTATTNVLSGAQIPTRVVQVEGDYAASTADYPDVDGLQTTATGFQSSMEALPSSLSTLAQNTLLTMANLDYPLQAKTLANALALLQQQMTGVASVNANVPAVGAQTNGTNVTPVGNPVFVWRVKDSIARTLQYIFPETILALITGDYQNTSVTAGQEPYSLIGQNAQSDFLAYDWLPVTGKYGSGASAAGNLTDATVNNTGATAAAGANALVNGDFQTYSNANLPDNWRAVVGSVGTRILNGGGGNAYTTGGGSLEFAGDGSTLIAVAQQFNTATSTGSGTGGTPYIPLPGGTNNACYCVNLWFKLSAGSPAAGVLRLSITDTSQNILNDDQGNALSTTTALTAIGDTNFHNFNFTFSLPQNYQGTTTTPQLRIDLSTALSNGTNIFFGRVGMTQMVQFYPGGPYFAAFSGNTKVNASGLLPDQWTFAVTNTLGKLQTACWRFFNPPSLGPQTPGIIVPNSGSPTVSDTLVA